MIEMVAKASMKEKVSDLQVRGEREYLIVTKYSKERYLEGKFLEKSFKETKFSSQNMSDFQAVLQQNMSPAFFLDWFSWSQQT